MARLIHIAKRQHLPGQGRPGDVFVLDEGVNTRTVFIALRDRSVVELDEFFWREWMPKGEKGETGEAGKDGRDGRDGKDITVDAGEALQAIRAVMKAERARLEEALAEALENAKREKSPHVRKLIELAVLQIRNRVNQ